MAGKFKINKSRNGKHHFNLVAGNGQVILSSEMYETKKAAENGVKSVKKNAGNEKRFDRRNAKNGKKYFVLKAGNGLEIGKSQMYKTASGMENGIKSVMNHAPDADIADTTGA